MDSSSFRCPGAIWARRPEDPRMRPANPARVVGRHRRVFPPGAKACVLVKARLDAVLVFPQMDMGMF